MRRQQPGASGIGAEASRGASATDATVREHWCLSREAAARFRSTRRVGAVPQIVHEHDWPAGPVTRSRPKRMFGCFGQVAHVVVACLACWPFAITQLSRSRHASDAGYPARSRDAQVTGERFSGYRTRTIAPKLAFRATSHATHSCPTGLLITSRAVCAGRCRAVFARRRLRHYNE